ncbi:lipopolysaccharide biosynthesis protein [Leuconostoc lactis]|uniref:lipopolysaccharide biosynthesis protein n=1 Tax=Leuconostoc lactis TaxID=1246 RepID=UPI00289688B1|nr:lipopolysaccharide biosynthesis protein [Leuconostoc lactis]
MGKNFTIESLEGINLNNFGKGMLFTFFGTYSNFIVQLIVNMILSRLLTPEDYGVVAIMQVFIIFFQLMVESGMGPAIIQNKELSKKDINIIFNYSFVLAIGMAILFGFFGQFLSYAYGDDIYIKLTWVQAISVFFSGLNVVPTAVLLKQLKFKVVNLNSIISNVCSAVTGISLSLLGFGVYALIYSVIISTMVNLILNFLNSKISFSDTWNIRPMKKIFNFSKNQFGFNFINYFSRNSDNILIGKFIGASALANYNKAYQLLMLPNQMFLSVINPVLQPVLAEYQDDVVYIRNFYFKIIKILAIISMPLSIFLSLSSEQIIMIMFGSQWNNAIVPFSYLALTVWCQMTVSTTGAIFQARNQTKILFFTGLVSAISLVSFILIGIFMGSIDSIAICLSIGFILVFFWNFYQLIVKSLEYSIFRFLLLFKSGVFLAGIMFACLKIVELFDPSNYIYSFVLKLLVFMTVMGVYLYTTNEKQEILDLLHR